MSRIAKTQSLLTCELSGRRMLAIVAAAILAAGPPLAFGISPGQTDNFEDGTTQGWNPGTTAVNISSGGPAGINDNYLQVSAGSFGGSARLVTFNQTQWLGNYLAAGVTGITLDLRNFGSNALPIRIAIREGAGGSTTPGYASTVPFNLPNDGAWHLAFFALDSGSLTPINSPQPLATDLANVADFRLLSSASPNTIGDAISGRIGVDNITAVPEPASIIPAGLALVGVWGFRRRPVSA